jgi:hypothetical protein
MVEASLRSGSLIGVSSFDIPISSGVRRSGSHPAPEQLLLACILASELRRLNSARTFLVW